MLMGSHNGAVDHRVFVVGIGGEVLEDPAPDARFGPPAKALVNVLPVAEAFRQVAPGYPGPVAIQYRFHEQAIVRRGYPDAARPTRQQVFDAIPLVIAQSVAVHRSAPHKADRLGIEELAAPESPVCCLVPICR
jgi:hypothetical protein